MTAACGWRFQAVDLRPNTAGAFTARPRGGVAALTTRIALGRKSISFHKRWIGSPSPAFCYISNVANGQKIITPSWVEEDSFDKGCCLPKHVPLVTPVIQHELGESASCTKLQRLFENSKAELHFLEERDEDLLSNRILILSRANKVKSALEMFASVEASGLHPNSHACNSLLCSLVRNGSLKDALQVFEIMRKKGLATSHTYSVILDAVASAEGYICALEMFKTWEKEGILKELDVVVYNTMISICGKTRNWIETEKTWRMLKENGTRGTMITYELLVSIFVHCGQSELSVDAFYEMIQSGLQPSEMILKALLSSCTKEGKWNLGLSIFQKMLDIGIKPNIVAFNSMINCLGKAGKDELAFKVYDLMKSVGHRADGYTWNALMCALYRSNRYADAIRLFQAIESEPGLDLNVHIYNTVLMSCQRLGLWERSLQLLWRMENCGMQMSSVSYNHAISTCEVARQPKVALQIYRHMIEQKCAPDTFTYLSLIRSCVWGSLWNEIEEIMQGAEPNSSLYNALIHGFCLRGKITLATKLYKKMLRFGLKPDGKTRAMMLQHLPNKRSMVGLHRKIVFRHKMTSHFTLSGWWLFYYTTEQNLYQYGKALEEIIANIYPREVKINLLSNPQAWYCEMIFTWSISGGSSGSKQLIELWKTLQSLEQHSAGRKLIHAATGYFYNT